MLGDDLVSNLELCMEAAEATEHRRYMVACRELFDACVALLDDYRRQEGDGTVGVLEVLDVDNALTARVAAAHETLMCWPDQELYGSWCRRVRGSFTRVLADMVCGRIQAELDRLEFRVVSDVVGGLRQMRMQWPDADALSVAGVRLDEPELEGQIRDRFERLVYCNRVFSLVNAEEREVVEI